MKKSNKAQIFMLDGIFSFVIVVIALSLALSYYARTIEDESLYSYNQNILNKFTKSSINDLNNIEIRNLFVSGQITNIENTIAQQVALFYNESNFILADNLSNVLIGSYEKNGVMMNLSLMDNFGNIRTLFITSPLRITSNNSQVRYQLSREVIAFNDNLTIIGPYTFTLQTWK